jgi:hypothetical protein
MANVSERASDFESQEHSHFTTVPLLYRVDGGKRRDILSKPNIADEQEISSRCVSAVAAQQHFRVREIIT